MKKTINGKRKKKAEKIIDRSGWPVVAICYDFDKTLSPQDMQNYSLIPDTGKTVDEFWEKCQKKAKENKMDNILSYMHEIIREGSSDSNGLSLKKEEFRKYGKNIELFPGVTTWFKRVEAIADSLNIKIEHYIISAGIKEIIEGTSIAKHFKSIFACSFYYNKKTGVAEWPAQVINATSKTQYLFRISKGTLDLSDEKTVHKTVDKNKLRIHFKNIIYIGDSITDVPAMRVVTKEGGISIGVYDNPGSKEKMINMYTLKNDGRINYYAKADYSKNSELENLIKKILEDKKLQFLSEEQTKTAKKEIIDYLNELLNDATNNDDKINDLVRQDMIPILMKKVFDKFVKEFKENEGSEDNKNESNNKNDN